MATALYRKFRPETFGEVIGQQHITSTLINQIKLDKVSHAYLFTGSRGTGKTTCARIFARAVNCKNPNDGSPCGSCAVCKALGTSGGLDITEIDAASNNGVEDARGIREMVKYPPVSGKFKVFIIDEVHMLSQSAFNALLKTLEEPPAHAIFILATTEVHKLPATILSRCMRFDFRLVATDELQRLIEKVYIAENKEYEENAVRYIAALGEGSVRDALSIADRCINSSAGKLRYSDVLAIMGAADKSSVRRLFESVARGEVGGALQTVDEILRAGKSVSLVAKEITGYARDLLVMKTSGMEILGETAETLENMKTTVGEFSADTFIGVMRAFSEIDGELRYSVSPRIVLETACVRACRNYGTDTAAMVERIARLEKRLSEGATAAPAAKISETDAREGKSPTLSIPADAFMVLGQLVTYMRTKESMRLYSLIGAVKDVEIDGVDLVVYSEGTSFLELSDAEASDAMRRGLLSLGYGIGVRVDKRKKDIDMDKEIEKFKRLAADIPVNIKK